MRKALADLGAEPDKIEVIYFGTDVHLFNPNQRGETLREELGIHDSPMVISLRGFRPIYNVETLVRAVPTVLKEVPEAKFLVLGQGPQETFLKELAETLGVSESIIFSGVINHDQLPRYLASADIYVSTSLSDAGIAASTAEAMASGLPVIITDFGDNSRWVHDDVNGFIIPMQSPEALADRLIYLLNNKDKRTEFGNFNRRLIEEKNNTDVEMGRMGKLYKNIIERYRK